MAQTTLKKENSGYNYKYTDLAQINGWCESNGIRYSQTITIIDGQQFIQTTYAKEGKEYGPFLGAQVIKAAPGGKVNEAQIYGSGLTYARRYSLLMCFGLATDDDDAECYTNVPTQAPAPQKRALNVDGWRKAMKDLEGENKAVFDGYLKNHGYKDMEAIPDEKKAAEYKNIKAAIDAAKEA